MLFLVVHGFIDFEYKLIDAQYWFVNVQSKKNPVVFVRI